MDPSSAAFLLLCLITLSHGQDVIEFEYNEHTYILSTSPLDWQAAREACEQLLPASDLVIVDNQDENVYLISKLREAGAGNTWISPNDLVSEGNFVNTDGTPLAFTYWLANEPNNGGGAEDCTHFWNSQNFFWNDISCDAKIGFFCELPMSVNDNGPVIEWRYAQELNETTEAVSDSVQFYCNISLMNSPAAGSTVSWWTTPVSGEATLIKSIQLQNSTDEKDFVLRESEWNEYGYGQELRCIFTDGQSGEDTNGRSFTVGLTVTPSRLFINEGECKHVEVQQTIPLFCKDKPYNKNTCDVDILVQTVDIQQLFCGKMTNDHVNILFANSACNRNLITSNVFNTVSTVSDLQWNNSFTLKVCGARDGLYDPYHTSHVSLNTYHMTGSSEYVGKQLGQFKVVVGDSDARLSGKSCHSVNDPHMRSFDGRNYEMQLEGPFYLYRHQKLPIEVQTMYENCNVYGFGGRRFQATCNCGVAIRAWDSTFVINKCYRFDPDTEERTNLQIIEHDSCSTNLEVTDEGSMYKISISTGTTIKINKSGFKGYMDVFVYASADDFDSTEGLCGTLNGDCTDEFKLRDSDTLSEIPESQDCSAHPYRTRPYDFADTWRVPDSENIFYGNLPSRVVENVVDETVLSVGDESCSCYFTEEDEMWQEKLCAPSTGIAAVCVETASTKSGCNAAAEPSRLDRKKRQAGEGFVFEYSTNSTAAEAAEWRNGWNESLANEFCDSAIRNSSLTSTCDGVVGVDVDQAIQDCVSDILLSGGTEFLESTLKSIQSPCIQELTRNITGWDNSTGNPVLPEFLTSVLCSDRCYTNGDCVNGTCDCNNGWYGADCDIEHNLTPQIVDVTGCTIDDCSSVAVYGLQFTDMIGGLQCIVARTQLSQDGIIEAAAAVLTQATYIHSSLVICAIPANVRPKGTTFTNKLEIQVSNNALDTTSERLELYVTPDCVECIVGTDNKKICNLQGGFCYVSGECLNSGDYLGCLYCEPLEHSFQWTANASCTGTDFKTVEEQEAYEEFIAQIDREISELRGNADQANGQSADVKTESGLPWQLSVMTTCVCVAAVFVAVSIVLIMKARAAPSI